MISSGVELHRAVRFNVDAAVDSDLASFATKKLRELCTQIDQKVLAREGTLAFDIKQPDVDADFATQNRLMVSTAEALVPVLKAMGIPTSLSTVHDDLLRLSIDWSKQEALGGRETNRLLDGATEREPQINALALMLLKQIESHLRSEGKDEAANEIDVEGFISGLKSDQRELFALAP